jgi:hypothetical protein
VKADTSGRTRFGNTPAPSRPGTVLLLGESMRAEEAWAELIAVAGLAEPVAVPAETFIYVRTDGPGLNYAGVWRWEWSRHEMWLHPPTMEPVEIRRDGTTVLRMDPRNVGSPQPGIARPTAGWLASLPTDPEALRTVLLPKTSGGWSAEHDLWEQVMNLCQLSDLLIPADVRVALYRALALEEGLIAQRMTLGDRHVLALARVEGTDNQQLLFDGATGRCVGRGSVYVGDPGHALGPGDGRSWLVWRQSVVTAVGRTG